MGNPITQDWLHPSHSRHGDACNCQWWDSEWTENDEVFCQSLVEVLKPATCLACWISLVCCPISDSYHKLPGGDHIRQRAWRSKRLYSSAYHCRFRWYPLDDDRCLCILERTKLWSKRVQWHAASWHYNLKRRSRQFELQVAQRFRAWNDQQKETHRKRSDQDHGQRNIGYKSRQWDLRWHNVGRDQRQHLAGKRV